MTFIALVFSVLMGIGSLAWGYSGSRFDLIVPWLLLFGGLWLLAAWQRWTWFSALGLFMSLVLAAFGMWLELSFGWMIAGALGGLLAWDLADFRRRMRFALRTEDLRDLERRHLARATIVGLAGLILASIPMAIRLEFTFEWAALLTLAAALGITQLVSWLRKGGE